MASAKKRQGANSGGKGKGKPNWMPYIIALGVLALGLALYGVQIGASGGSGSGSARKGAAKSSVPKKSIAELELQLQTMVTGLKSVSGRGETGIFKKINAMSDQAQAVLANAAAAGSDDERRRILEEGLAMKADWLSVLHGHAASIDEEAEKAKKDEFVPHKSEFVAVLTEENFTDYISSNELAMIEFYAPWCPHCKELAPEFELSAKKLAGRAGFAVVDGSSQSKLSGDYNVTGYPTLKWFVRGRPLDYLGPRTAPKITAWVEERLQPNWAELERSEDVSAALAAMGESKDLKVVLGEGQKDSEVFTAFEATSEHFRGQVVFIWVVSGNESLTLHRSDGSSDRCDAAVSCRSPDEAIAWLDDRLSFDPDLADDA